MNNAKAMILPVVAVATISLYCKAQSSASKTQTDSAASSSSVSFQPPAEMWSGSTSSTSNFVPIVNPYADSSESSVARLLNAGLQSIGKEDSEPRRVHFEFTLTLPPKNQ